MNNINLGANQKLAPLISFYALVDVDVGLINLIRKEYLNTKVFNPEFFNRSKFDIISDLYYRKEENPLLLFSKDNVDIETLDQYYSDFFKDRLDDILSLSVFTEIKNLIELFNNSKDISAHILCYNESQRKILEDEHFLKKNRKILIDELVSESSKDLFTQFYFNKIEEANLFTQLKGKTFYFSKCSLNLLDDESDIKESDIIFEIIKGSRNQISLYNLYNENIITKVRK